MQKYLNIICYEKVLVRSRRVFLSWGLQSKQVFYTLRTANAIQDFSMELVATLWLECSIILERANMQATLKMNECCWELRLCLWENMEHPGETSG